MHYQHDVKILLRQNVIFYNKTTIIMMFRVLKTISKYIQQNIKF